MTKKCTKCGTEKCLSRFSKCINAPDGLQYQCKDCDHAAYRKNHPNARPTKLQPKNGGKVCSKCMAEKSQTEFNKNKHRPDGLCDWCRNCTQAGWVKNKNRNNTQKAKYFAKRRKIDPMFKFICALRTLIRKWFERRGFHKNEKTQTFQIIGCSPEKLRDHLSANFQPGWAFDNRSKIWHIDHIIPLKTAQTIEDVIKLCHYTNLQPLSGPDNLRKGAKLNWKAKN